jgi:hypothetical protein
MPRKEPDLTAYEAWLKKQGYQPSTVVVTLRHLRTVAVEGRIPQYREAHVQRYLRYVAETKKNPMGKKFAQQMKAKGLVPSAKIRKQGRRTKDPLQAGDWAELRSVLRRGDDISKLLVAYMQSPYRISEFLLLDANKVTEEDVCDKRSRDWLKKAGGRGPVYAILCDTERCAYSRMRRRLQVVGEKMSLTVDLDTLYKSFHELEAA